jgi:hypothetical protein
MPSRTLKTFISHSKSWAPSYKASILARPPLFRNISVNRHMVAASSSGILEGLSATINAMMWGSASAMTLVRLAHEE